MRRVKNLDQFKPLSEVLPEAQEQRDVESFIRSCIKSMVDSLEVGYMCGQWYILDKAYRHYTAMEIYRMIEELDGAYIEDVCRVIRDHISKKYPWLECNVHRELDLEYIQIKTNYGSLSMDANDPLYPSLIDKLVDGLEDAIQTRMNFGEEYLNLHAIYGSSLDVAYKLMFLAEGFRVKLEMDSDQDVYISIKW